MRADRFSVHSGPTNILVYGMEGADRHISPRHMWREKLLNRHEVPNGGVSK